MLNRVILIGRLTKDPELRYTQVGVAVTQFTLAVDRPFSGGDGKEKEADFLNIVVWRQLAETCANYLRKGKLTAVEGRIQIRHYTPDDSDRRVYVTEIIADNVRFLERKKDGDGESTGGSSGSNQSSGSRPTSGNDPFHDDGKPIDISDDDLPF